MQLLGKFITGDVCDSGIVFDIRSINDLTAVGGRFEYNSRFSGAGRINTGCEPAVPAPMMIMSVVIRCTFLPLSGNMAGSGSLALIIPREIVRPAESVNLREQGAMQSLALPTFQYLQICTAK